MKIFSASICFSIGNFEGDVQYIYYMSLPINTLRKRLQDLIENSERGYMAALSALSSVPDGTIHIIAYGRQKTVTYKVWRQLHNAEPKLPPPPDFSDDAAETKVVPKLGFADYETECFVAAFQQYYSIDDRFHSAEEYALSVGLTGKKVKCLLSGEFDFHLDGRRKTVIARSFGMTPDEFVKENPVKFQQRNEENRQHEY